MAGAPRHPYRVEMLIARPPRPHAGSDRRARWLAALVLAALAVSAVAVPAAAVNPASGTVTASPSPTASGSQAPSAAPSVAPSPPATPVPSAPAAPTPSASPVPSPASPSPSASAPPSPSAQPTPGAPTPTAGPTATPAPTAAPKVALPAAWPTTPTVLGTTIRFYGRGWGHGVGLNQYGARGRALDGQTAPQILAAYFRGTTLSTVSAQTPVRVLVLAGFTAPSSAPLVIRGQVTTWTIDGIAKVFPKDGLLKAWRTTATVDGVATTTWRLRVYAADGTTVLHSAVVSGQLWIRPTSGSTRLQLDSKPSTYDTYRGALRVILGAGSATVVNHVPLDTYLRGVVPVEMPPSWPAEALKAQAVAARSYTVRRLRPTTGSFDVYDDTRSQVYRGIEAESPVTNALLAATPGQILRYGTSVVNAFFHSTGGGATESNEYVFVSSSGAVGSPVAYLRGIADRRADGTAYDSAAPYYSWYTSALSRATLSAMFRADARTNVGDLLRLDLTKRGVSGRLYRVTLSGTGGTKTVSADVFRAVYNARRPLGTLPLRGNMFDTRPLPLP